MPVAATVGEVGGPHEALVLSEGEHCLKQRRVKSMLLSALARPVVPRLVGVAAAPPAEAAAAALAAAAPTLASAALAATAAAADGAAAAAGADWSALGRLH